MANQVRWHILYALSNSNLHSARIRIHRYHAFSDIPLFIKNHCDLATPDSFDIPGCFNDETMLSSFGTCGLLTSLPFTYEQSAGICVESALTIARQLRNLPTPVALYTDGVLFRTMPTSSCCAMQASYALLTQLCGICVMSQISLVSKGSTVNEERLAEELRHGLEGIIATLKNFAVAFEAVGGMKGE